MSQTSESTSAPLLSAEHGGVCTLTLNRPHQYNAFSEEMLAHLETELDRIESSPTVRAVVIAGNGPAFCAGHDLKEMRSLPEANRARYRTLFEHSAHLSWRLTRLAQPIIARVHGIATAAGCQLVAACDLAVAAEEARFAVSGINLGLFCSTPSVALSRNVGQKEAFKMLFTGEFVDADTAKTYGLVNDVVPLSALNASVDALVQAIIAKPAVAVATGKRMFYQQRERNLADAYRYSADVMAENMMASDTTEGIDAFIEKRPPLWAKKSGAQ